MNLQKFEDELERIESKYKKIFDDQKIEFESKLESIKNEAIESVLKLEKQRQKPVQKLSFDKTVDPELFAKFNKKPYVILPGDKKNTLHILVPKFKGDFQVGWLKDEIDEYYRYEVNQYSVFFGDVPDEILQEIELPEPIDAKVIGNHVFFDAEKKAEIKRALPKFTTDWTLDSARITQGHEFDIISEILQSGNVPFEKIPVQKEDLILSNQIKLRDYQKDAWNNFLKTGAIGVFHPTGSGKSFIGMKGLESIKVGGKRNLIISPRRTLVEQWDYYTQKYIPNHDANILISTYQGFHNFDEEFGLVLYDECHTLPAPNFSKLSTIKTKYRMGLSASPFREDGKNHLIITLTGFPQNLNWPKYMKEYGPGYHTITVHIVRSRTGKIGKAKQLFNARKRTMIYSHSLDIGDEIAGRLELPFIHGDTTDRLAVIEQNHSFVASSVFTEGVSISNLDHIIEIDFHFGSRREELQLTGRLMHSLSKNKRHDIIMTETEFDNYKKRILVLEEKGFHVKIVENTD